MNRFAFEADMESFMESGNIDINKAWEVSAEMWILQYEPWFKIAVA